MYTRSLVLLICTIGAVDCNDINSTILEKLPEMMSYLCPEVNVCGNSYQTPVTSSYEGACCTACSCESNCETNGNCCFPSKQPYISGDVNLNTSPFYKRECLHPTTFELDRYQRMLYQPYFMITSVPNDLLCGSKVIFLGSQFPIYSKKRNRIYKNIVCANADGVRDGIPWNVILSCSFSPRHQGEENFTFREVDPLAIVHQMIEQGASFNDWNCHVNFEIKSIKMIESLRCYTDVIDNCPYSGSFKIPNDIDYSASEIIDACTTGLVSPYLKNRIYANVFCFICNNETYNHDNVCEKSQSVLSLGGNQGVKRFTGLIDQRSLLEGFKDKTEMSSRIPMACGNSVQNKTDCRQIYCPLGQLYDRFGKCKYYISKVHNQIFIVTVNITSNMYLNLIRSDMLYWNQNKTLISPWPEDWQISSIALVNTSLNMNYTHLTIQMLRDILSIRTAIMMKEIEKYAKRNWILKQGDTSYIYQSELATWDYLHVLSSRGSNLNFDSVQFGNRSQNIIVPDFTNELFTPTITHTFAALQVISRLHFCSLVELTPFEYVLSKNNLTIFNFRTQRYMFAVHSFALEETTERADWRVKICLEDSGLSVENQTPILSQQEVSTLFLTFTIISKWIFFVMF